MHTLEPTRHPRCPIAPALSAAALLLGMVTVHAQNPDKPAADAADSITVTGSRILRSEQADNSPRVSIDAREIARRGIVNAEQLVREMPQAVAGVSSAMNLGNPGVTTLDLRGLRAERTLTLVDGKRFVPYDSSGVVDINNIPTSLLERIDIVTGGASTVYGSDAMAGVVNFILRKDFEGLEVNTSFLTTQESDGRTKDIGLTAGRNFAGGRGNVTMFLGWTDRDELRAASRSFSEFALATSDGLRAGSQVDTQGSLFCLPACFPPGGTSGGDFLVSFSPQGNLAPTGSRLFNYNPYNYLQVPEDRLQGTGLFNFAFSDSTEAYGRLTAARTRIQTSIAPSGTFFTRQFTIPLSSPGLSAQARGTLTDRIVNATANAPEPTGGSDGLVNPQYDLNGDGAIDANASVNEYLARRTTEVGARQTDNHTTAWQALGGLKGTLFDTWRWDVSLQYGRTELKRAYANDVDQNRMQASILGCPPGSPAGCVAGNFFGDGNLNADAARFIALTVRDTITSDQRVFGGSISGHLGESFKIPGASPIGLALGAEYREEKSFAAPDDCLSAAGCSGGFGTVIPVRARYDVKELFGEMLVPLLEDRPFAYRLNLETGLRLSDYSTVGRTSTYKAGGDWAPVSTAFRLRGLYQKAVRAPNIFEFGSPRQQSLLSASGDPCSGTVSSAAIRALCIATGVPASAFNGAASSVPGPIGGQINVFTGGNPNLKEEDSDTFTAGFVWEPQGALHGFSTQLDWYRIEINHAISTLGVNDVLNSCYSTTLNPGNNPGSASCGLVLRNPATGGLVGNPAYGISLANENIALRKTEGVDLTLAYDLSAGDLGKFRFSLFSTYVIRNQRQAAEELPARECAGRYGSSCGVPDPKLRFVQDTTWTLGEFDLGYRWRYLKGTSFDNPSAAVEAFRTIGDYQTVDLLFGWTPAKVKDLAIHAGINNAFDKLPPLVGEDAGPTEQNSGNTYPGTFDALGRSFFLSARKGF